MIWDRKMLSIILLAGNLFVAGSLFLYVCFSKEKRQGSFRSPARIPGLFLGWILEAAVFIAGLVRVTGLIITGIELPGAVSQALTGVWLFFAESLILVYLLWRVWNGDFRSERSVCCEKENRLAMFLILMLTVLEWKETNTEKAFVLHVFFLLLAFVPGYFRHHRKKGENSERMSVFGQDISGDSMNPAMLSPGQRQNDYLKNVDVQYQRTRELWHDLKNHINVLEILAKEEKVSELADYLKSFRQDVEIHMLPMQTGCTPVDALLSDKLYCARKANIRVSVQLCDLSDTTIRHIDLCTVLGNLLDNAVEACGRLPQKEAEPFLSLKLKQQEGFYYLTIVNSAPEPVEREGKYKSAKGGYDNVAGHGLGLRSVERIAHQYGGSMVTDYKEGEFRVILRMENPVLG